MKVDLIKTYPAGALTKQKHGNSLEYSSDYGAGLCEKSNQKLNRGYYDGSFTGSQAAVNDFKNLGNTFFDKIARSQKFKDLVEVFENKTVVASTLVALVVAGVARPLTNLAMAGKDDREDSIYAASHAISSALVGFVISSIIMAPFDKAFRKIKEDPKKYLTGLEEMLDVSEIGKRKLEKSKPYKKISKVAQMIPDTVVLGIPKAMLTIALIPPILGLFGLKKGHKKTAANPEVKPETNNKPQNLNYNKNLVNSPAFEMVKGGVK